VGLHLLFEGKFIFPPSKFLFSLRKFWKTFFEVFFKAKKVSHHPNIKENLAGEREITMKKSSGIVFRCFFVRKEKLGDGKRNHLFEVD
jgi:hypothetical protein